MNGYVDFYLEGLDKTKEAILNSVINEGKMRQTEKIVEMIERKMTEAYASNDTAMIDLLQSLIAEIESV